MLRVFICLMVAVWSCGFAFSQSVSEVRVLVLDYRTGNARKGWRVGLLVGSDWQLARTGKDGVALFSIGKIFPKTLKIDAEAGSWSEWSCTNEQSFETSEVLERGTVARLLSHPLCRNHTSSIPALPGVVVIYGRHLNPWLTFRRVLWEAFYG